MAPGHMKERVRVQPGALYLLLPMTSLTVPLPFTKERKEVKGREQEVIVYKIKDGPWALEAAGWYSCFLPYGLRAVDSSPPSTPKGR